MLRWLQRTRVQVLARNIPTQHSYLTLQKLKMIEIPFVPARGPSPFDVIILLGPCSVLHFQKLRRQRRKMTKDDCEIVVPHPPSPCELSLGLLRKSLEGVYEGDRERVANVL